MKKVLSTTLTVAVLLLTSGTSQSAEMTWTFAVQLGATVQTSPARIELNWAVDPLPISGYSVQRKSPTATTWSEATALPGYATTFVDETVSTGESYEYQVIKYGAGYTGYGYIAVGVQAPLVDQRGKVILLVDDTLSEPLAAEIERLRLDLAGDGWTVISKEVARDAPPAEVRGLIQNEYRSDPEQTRAVFLLGHLPVVRSGYLNVDGHGARPMPADVFYGEMDGVWTDTNRDGIYDQNTLPSSVELQVGRVDFADLPGAGSPTPYPSELELMKRYLDKDHAFRHATIRPSRRALIGDATGNAGGQAYAASGYRNFAALVGRENIVTANSEADAPAAERWISRLTADDYLWTWAGGAGSDTSIGGVGTHPPYSDVWASDLLELKAKGTFYMMIGSWLVDWSKPDNIMRSALAAPVYGLTASWSGRPHHFYHHMGIGETIGYGIRVSQNNSGVYQNQVQRQLRGIHIALLGDPTLRMHQLAPPRDLQLQPADGAASLQWKPSPDAVSGYHVYRGSSPYGPFTRISADVIGDTRFTDTLPDLRQTNYQVKAVALQSGPSGSYVNTSQGISVSTPGVAALLAPAAKPASLPAPGETIWIDDKLPEGATGHTYNDSWNWITSAPAPFAGSRAHQSDNVAGPHYHFMVSNATPLAIGGGDTLFAYVYLDPANPPRQIMLSWLADDHWEHRAYWGENLVAEGINDSPGRRSMGALPAAGNWVKLEVPARAVDMENRTATGMGFTLFDGRAAWDLAGKAKK